MTVTYVRTTSRGVLETSCSMAEVGAMLAVTATVPAVSGPRLIAIDIGGETIALDAADIVRHSPSPLADELTIGDAAQVTDQPVAAEPEGSTPRRKRTRR